MEQCFEKRPCLVLMCSPSPYLPTGIDEETQDSYQVSGQVLGTSQMFTKALLLYQPRTGSDF
jgi:hypothetical protein